MPPKLHYYNPAHETFILKGTPFYTPSLNVRKMLKDLAVLPAWYAAPGDYIFAAEGVSSHFFSSIPEELHPKVTFLSEKDISRDATSLPEMEATPWGISPQSIYLYNTWKDKYQLKTDIPTWKNEYATLAKRQTAVMCLNKIKALLPEYNLPPAPLFFSALPDIEKYLQTTSGAYLLKTPYSSSGRGLLWLDNGIIQDKDKNWINGAISKQQAVSIEPVLDKSDDFALEFYSDGKGNITYQGISIFKTSKRGAYESNLIMNRQAAQSHIESRMGKEKFQKIKESVMAVLQEIYSRIYKGYLGVDMLIYNTHDNQTEVHPCLEINMRYTMGMAAIRIADQYIHREAKGIFRIDYERDPDKTYEKDESDKKMYPQRMVDGKLKEGYLSLCPVSKETNYRAYIIVE